MNKKPNIVFILTDDLGYGDLSCYGQKTWKTPCLDRMAQEGIRFTDFYTTSPVCSPARASIVSGLHSGHLPIRQLRDPFLPNETVTIPKKLREAFGLLPNMEVEFYAEHDGIKLRKKTKRSSPVQSLYGVLSKNDDTDRYIEEIRGR